MAAAAFGIFFVGVTAPITSQNFLQVDATHWVFDTKEVAQDYRQLVEIALVLMQPTDPAAGLGLYISVGGAEWQYRGFVSNSRPSEVMPLQWPSTSEVVVSQAPVQIGIALEPQDELMQKEGSKLAGRQDFAKRVALDLYRFMESFNVGQAGNQLILPTDVLDKWFVKFDNKFRRDPDFLMHVGQKS